MIYLCCDRRRRTEIANDPVLNGIDYLEVLDLDAPAGSPRQQTLLVRLLKAAPALTEDNIAIEGGERFDEVRALWVVVADAIPPAMIVSGEISAAEAAYFGALPDPDQVLVVRTDSAGDYSPYRLRLVTASNDPTPPTPQLDPRLSAIEFSFKVECFSDFDCKPRHRCPPPPATAPKIDLLAKDYASFRRLMLDRMALLAPDWTERSPADLGMVLVELLAHVGDQLSYHQDAVATEAYLGTARRRISVRRHARLVDYHVSDGSNARAWVQFEVDSDVPPVVPGQPIVPRGTRLFTLIPGVTPPTVADDPRVWGAAQIVYETREDLAELFAAHSELHFYTWSDEECCLPRGATSATLVGAQPDLEPGMVLVFEEVLGPQTGHSGDADPAHRHAVRLTEVTPATDLLGTVDVTEIRWDPRDALPFALCISARTDRAHDAIYVENVSVARGNVVLADHGRTIEDEPLGAAPEPVAFYPPEDADRCDPEDRKPILPRFRPRLAESPLTQAAPYEAAGPAADAMSWDPRRVLPEIELAGEILGVTLPWTPQRDLLASDSDMRHFVAEVESDRSTLLRFGDDEHGERPEPGTLFSATYRVGNGRAGNIGVDALRHAALPIPEIRRVRNLTPGVGGREPQSIEDVRKEAPVAFLTQERAVTQADYAEVSERFPEVEKAAATFRWTGSWHTVFVTADRSGGLAVDADFERALAAHLERYRMARYDLEVDGPRPVSLEIELRVCVHPDHFRSHVRSALEEQLSDEVLADGRLGVFHPDNFTFGQTVYLSRVYAAAQGVPGVASVNITTFQRQDEPETDARDTGALEIGRLEIARLENDRNYPGHGVLRIELEGGK